MAAITLTQNYSFLEDWPGRLLQAEDGTTILTRTATTFTFKYPATGVSYPGFKVQVTGVGLEYDNGDPVGGRMTLIRIFDASNNLVMSFSNLAPNTLSSDFAQFFNNVFGTGDQGHGPDGYLAISHLMSSNDVITGTAFDDNRGIAGVDPGNDLYNMLGGNDWVDGGIGDDTINGGDGYDTLSYSVTTWNEGLTAFRGIVVDFRAGTVLDPWGGLDRFTGIEEFQGSRFNDLFTGGDGRDRFTGFLGRDTISGGNATFDAQGNFVDDHADQAAYDSEYWHGGRRGIVVNLETSFVNGSIRGTIRDSFGTIDTVIDIERVVGTRFNDVFVGSRTDNVFAGGEGTDSYRGLGGAFDRIDFDRWFGDNPIGNVVIDLSRATGQIINDGFGNTETSLGIEAFHTGGGNDSLRGSAGAEEFNARSGADTMAGGGGRDTFIWNDTGEFNEGDRVLDFTAAGPAADVLAFEVGGFAGMTTTLVLVNGAAATQAVGTFIFRAANDTLYWDADGTGAGAAQAVAVLVNVNALSSINFDLWG